MIPWTRASARMCSRLALIATNVWISASTLLGRRADHQDVPGERIARTGERQPGPERAGRDDVVATAVADVRQRVVFGQDRDTRPRLGPLQLSAKGGFEAANAPFYRKTGPRQVVGQSRAGAELLEGQLGIGVNRVAGGDQMIAKLVYRRTDPSLPLLTNDAHPLPPDRLRPHSSPIVTQSAPWSS